MKRRYLVVYEEMPANYGAHAPDVPGCASLGDTLEQTRELMQEGLHFHLTTMMKDGDPLPETVTTVFDFAQEIPERGIERCIVEWMEVEIPTATELPALTVAG